LDRGVHFFGRAFGVLERHLRPDADLSLRQGVVLVVDLVHGVSALIVAAPSAEGPSERAALAELVPLADPVASRDVAVLSLCRVAVGAGLGIGRRRAAGGGRQAGALADP